MYSLKEALQGLLLEDREGQLKNLFLKNNKLSEQEFETLYEADPTQSKKYAPWLMTKFYKDYKEPALVKNTKSDGPVPNEPDKPNKSKVEKLTPEGRQKIKTLFEDLPKATEYLELFNRIGAKFPKRDIQQYSIEEFIEDGFKVKEELTTFELEKGKTDRYPELIIGTVDGFTVYKLPQNRPDLFPVNGDLAGGANWCTTFRQSTFDHYNRRDAIYVFLKKGSAEKYQHDQYSGQWKDRANQNIDSAKLKKDFQQFLGDTDGRIYDADQLKNLKKYEIGKFNSQGQEYPMYKIGNKYYTIIKDSKTKQEEAIYYDPDIKRFKDSAGRTKTFDLLMKYPYLDFLKAIYAQLKKEGNVKTFNNVLRLLLNLDVPPKQPGEWYKIGDQGGGIDVANSDLTELPENLWIQGNLDLEGSKITKLPKRLKVDGDIITVDGTVIKSKNK